MAEDLIIAWVVSVFAAFLVGLAMGICEQQRQTDVWRQKCFDNLEHYRRIMQKEEGKGDG